MSFALWLTGLSGSGKSAVAKALLAQLRDRGLHAAVLESDVLRTQLTPFPRYDEEERDFVYRVLGDLAAYLVKDLPVIIDATAHRRGYRDRARSAIERFAEIYVNTPLEICAARDTKGLYKPGAAKTLPGVQVAYEAPLSPELVISGAQGTPAEAAAQVLSLLERRAWLKAGR